MDAQTVGWMVFLVLIKNFSAWNMQVPFELVTTELTSTEGSCIEINCRVIRDLDDEDAYWFWMKDAKYIDKDYVATIIYSTNISQRPVSPDFVDRVQYIGSSSLSRKIKYASSSGPLCGILICNLTKADNGQYSFRFVGKALWATKKNSTLTVKENPCPLTFMKPPAVNVSDTITLTCSTLSTCLSSPQIEELTQPPLTQHSMSQGKRKTTTVTFTASLEDDGKVFSCTTKDNMDKYLIRNISVTVEYAPKDIQTDSSKNVKEGQSVTLTCSAKGSPPPNLSWFKEEELQSSKAEWNIPSINDSQSGEYYCKAENRYGKIKSNPVVINVTYVPHVEIEMTLPVSVVKQGDKIILKCDVKRSNPKPGTYTWLRDENEVGWEQTLVIENIRPEAGGNYKCTATNSVGKGISRPHQIEVQYRPRQTRISIPGSLGKSVKANSFLTFTCDTDANPTPKTYSWYRYNKNKQTDFPRWSSKTTQENQLKLSAQRTDEACYMCNATNDIDTGDDSESLCIKILYPPTKPTLLLVAEVTEGQSITISCTVESFPPSTLTLTRTPNYNHQPSIFTHHDIYSQGINKLHHTFIVNSTHDGFYTCTANNSEGSNTSKQRKLVVKYTPINVKVEGPPGLVVNENTLLKLHCNAQSYPSVTSVTWMKVTDGKDKTIRGSKTLTFIVGSASPSDSGLYSCEAHNEIGSGKSQRVEVKVRYAPKRINILRAPVRQEHDGRSSVMLSCSSLCYPPVNQYIWYRRINGNDLNVSNLQNYTVFSDKPGVYYCSAGNEIDKRSSDPVHLFNRDFMKILKFSFLCLTILLLIFAIFLVYRYKRKKSIQQGTRNTQPLFGVLGLWNGTGRGNLGNETALAEPFRSRDDLLQDQWCHPEAQGHQPNPDSTPASNICSVYSTLNLPPVNQAPTAEKPTRQQDGQTKDDSLNYASLHFWDKPENKQVKAEEVAVYAKVSRPNPPKKREQERLEDYENVKIAHVLKSPNPLNDDTDTSEEEVELNYTQML
ncbi:B-cell receptor CD22 isoform X2 [Xiphias gladius]|uniref:B-cell receptor CD22 isoform X2 n=1 Tax=Xiphias gladius TaxID=8245 RepID=UPI001A997D58|nr:B-cell receptor CD22 isoform X2 [Xiphias gladius]